MGAASVCLFLARFSRKCDTYSAIFWNLECLQGLNNTDTLEKRYPYQNKMIP